MSAPLIEAPSINVQTGGYMLDTPERCAAAMLTALRMIEMVPYWYPAIGANAQRDEMQRIAHSLILELRRVGAFVEFTEERINDDGTLDAEAREQAIVDADGGVQ